MTIVTTTAHVPSPIGRLVLVAEGDALARICLPGDPDAPAATVPAARSPARVLRAAAAQLGEYFAGTRATFELPLAPSGTAFQRRVWSALGAVPHGTTTSYGALARHLGLPRAARAVGAANGKNPLPIVIPCHRVIGSDGALTGYAGGLARKRWLLRREQSAR